MNARGKSIDKTYLSLDTAEERGFIHRDYIAHCLRWSHVMKRLAQSKRYATARILDVGCGRELPLARTLYSSRFIPQKYYGVDVGPIEDRCVQMFDDSKFQAKVWENCDVLSLSLEDLDGEEVNWITMFEVAEHVEPKHLLMILRFLKSIATDDATFLVSTPCWNRTDCADNHVNEMTYNVFGAVLEATGWVIEANYGTFASIRDYEHLLVSSPEGLLSGKVPKHVFDALREYYDTNLLSVIFAPLFPAQSRNCLWVCRPGTEQTPALYKKFPTIVELEKPWGSSAKWKELLD